MSGSPLPPGVLRRKLQRQQRRAERLRNLWRLLVFSAIAAGAGYVLLRQGWSLQGPSQVEVIGSRLVTRDQVIEAAGIGFPQPLLALKPREFARGLEATLPVEQVRVTRLMLPPRLRVELRDRKVVARAERRTPGGLEQGYVDGTGRWIPIHQHHGAPLEGDGSLRVSGWAERQRPALAQVLEARGAFGGGLREIRFEPDGSLWLETASLGPLRLGPVDGRLGRRLEVAAHLHRTLPARLGGGRPRLIDLSDPEQPELSLQGSAPPQTTAAKAAAGPPPGGQ